MAGREMVALGQHGAGQSYSSEHSAYPGGRNQERASLFLVPNRHAEARTRHAYPRARVELVGCPKLDTLPTKERTGEPVVAFSFHWSSSTIAPEMVSAWDHYHAAMVAAAKHRRVIGHAHPRQMSKVHRWYRKAGIDIVPSFADVLRRADLYVVDNSSSLFEFAATGRPVVVLNIPTYRREVNHGLRFWDAAGVGVNCDRPADLDDAITEALEDSAATRARREAALDIVYTPRRGGAELAAAALVDWAATYVSPPFRPERRTQVQRFRAVQPIA
jgi:glycosyltransferase involved in cell wall biosynthesis